MKQLLFLFLVIPLSCFAPPGIEEIKRFASRVKPEYQHLSPIHAHIALETGQLQRLSQLGDKTLASTQLLHHLFKIQDNRLYCANNKSKPAAHFTPKIIANLVAALEQKTLATDYQTTWQPKLLKKVDTELQRTSAGKMTATKLGAFLGVLKQAQVECEQQGIKRFFPYTALLGYVCLKASSGQDVGAFFEHLRGHGVDALYHDDTPPAPSVSQALYETALSSQIDRRFYKCALPPMAKESDLVFDGTRARDCVDTLIRTFFDHLFYDSTTHRFDLTKKLPPTVKPSPELRTFYAQYSKPTDVNGSSKIAHDWMERTAGRSPVIYRYVPQDSRHFVVRPFLCNIIVILNQLLGTEGKNFAQLCDMLSTPERTLRSEYEKRGEQDIMHIAFDQKEPPLFTLSMETTTEHGCMQRKSKHAAVQDGDQKMRHALLTKLASGGYNQEDHSLLSVFASQDPDELKQDMQTFVNNQDIPLPNLLDFYAMHDVDAEEVDLILFDSMCGKLRQYPVLKPLLLNLIFDLEGGDTFYYYHNIEILARHKVWEVDLAFNGTIRDLLSKINNETYLEKARTVLLQNGYKI